MFGAPFPRPEDSDPRDYTEECGARFGMTFLAPFHELREQKPFAIVPDERIDPNLRARLGAYRESTQIPLPLGCLLVYLQCWVLLQGAVSLEVFGHLEFALPDAEPLFALTLDDIALRLGF